MPGLWCEVSQALPCIQSVTYQLSCLSGHASSNWVATSPILARPAVFKLFVYVGIVVGGESGPFNSLRWMVPVLSCTLLHDVYASIECMCDMPQIWVYKLYKLCGPVLVNDLIHDVNASTGCTWHMPYWVYRHYKHCMSMFKINLILQIGITAFYASKEFFDCINPALCTPDMHTAGTLCNCNWCCTYKGGHKVHTLTYSDIKDYINVNDEQMHKNIDKVFQFVDYVS